MIVGKRWWSDGHNAQTARKQRLINDDTQLAFLPFCQVWKGVPLPSTVNLICKIPHRPTQRFPSKVILDLMKLTIKINH